MNIHQSRLTSLRQTMKSYGIDAYIITGTDAHQSEYIADHWNAREWATGFTGSAGQVVITQDFAGLWTDSRYFLQGDQELQDSGYSLMKQVVQYTPEYLDWVATNLPSGSKIMMDGYTVSIASHDYMKKKWGDKFTIELDDKVLPLVWENRPSLPRKTAMLLSDQYAGESAKSKIEKIRQWLEKQNCSGIMITALDDIAWMLNLRGNDVEYNPVVISYFYLAVDQLIWFVDQSQVSQSVVEHLSANDIRQEPYEKAAEFLFSLPKDSTVSLDFNQCNIRIKSSLNCKIFKATNPIILLKSQKNEIEITNIKKAMVDDGLALTKAFKWLEQNIGHTTITEHDFKVKIASFRSESQSYLMESFGAIIGYQGNGAIIHYHPSEENSANLSSLGILLCDSGGQYLTGTTDITRTIALGPASGEAKKDFTLVLKGMIALSQAVFPKGTTGAQLDILARQHLWNAGKNYSHGTGHGIGFCLNVHEGPQGFAAVTAERGRTPFLKGMILSNEPGFYLENLYGIRIENVMAVVESSMEEFMKFDTLTLFPIDYNLIQEDLLTDAENNWLKKYHQTVFEQLSPHLDDEHAKWLAAKCGI
jgi:Xaa-Pro aminopeptidase